MGRSIVWGAVCVFVTGSFCRSMSRAFIMTACAIFRFRRLLLFVDGWSAVRWFKSEWGADVLLLLSLCAYLQPFLSFFSCWFVNLSAWVCFICSECCESHKKTCIEMSPQNQKEEILNYILHKENEASIWDHW